MDNSEINDWLQGFVANLTIGGERVPLERVIATRLDGLLALRDQGLTWHAIEALIIRAGGRRKDGTPISGDQLRAAFARLSKRRIAVQVRPPPSARSKRIRPATKGANPSFEHRPTLPLRSMLDVLDKKDVSTDEINAALLRIKSRP